jgi:hypothetical protein
VYNSGETAGETGPVPYFVIEYVDGDTLRPVHDLVDLTAADVTLVPAVAQLHDPGAASTSRRRIAFSATICVEPAFAAVGTVAVRVCRYTAPPTPGRIANRGRAVSHAI